jgi:hypothetical protein
MVSWRVFKRKKLMPIACSREVTACFVLKYVGNRQAQEQGCKKDGPYLVNRSASSSHNCCLPSEPH